MELTDGANALFFDLEFEDRYGELRPPTEAELKSLIENSVNEVRLQADVLGVLITEVYVPAAGGLGNRTQSRLVIVANKK